GGIVDDLRMAVVVARRDSARRQRNIGERAFVEALPSAVATDDKPLHDASRNTASSANALARHRVLANGAPGRPLERGTALSIVNRSSRANTAKSRMLQGRSISPSAHCVARLVKRCDGGGIVPLAANLKRVRQWP